MSSVQIVAALLSRAEQNKWASCRHLKLNRRQNKAQSRAEKLKAKMKAKNVGANK
jgi:hypothetical protein